MYPFVPKGKIGYFSANFLDYDMLFDQYSSRTLNIVEVGQRIEIFHGRSPQGSVVRIAWLLLVPFASRYSGATRGGFVANSVPGRGER
jgi:hypothetical protein